MFWSVFASMALCLVKGADGFGTPPLGPAAKPVIRTAADLPSYVYSVTQSPDQLLTSPEKFARFAQKVRTDVEALLHRYEIQDKATLSQLHQLLFRLDCLEHRFTEAQQQAAEAIRFMDKAADRNRFAIAAELDAQALEALLGSRPRGAGYRSFLQHWISQATSASAIDALSAMQGYCVRQSSASLQALAIGDMGQAVQANKQVNFEQAAELISYRLMMVGRLPQCEITLEVLNPWLRSHRPPPQDFWAARRWNLSPADRGSPVPIAIWDTGVDRGLFREQLALPMSAPVPGMDLDGNQTQGDLLELTPAERARLPETLRLTKGWGDTFLDRDSPEAELYKRAVKHAKTPAEALDLDHRIFAVADPYGHGTAVASLALETNPFVRLLVARFRFPDRASSRPLSVQGAQHASLAFSRLVDYFQAHQVRVVNMSWGIDLNLIESRLQKQRDESNPEKRQKLAQSILSIYQEGMRKALARAPEIVFVAAAGNSDADPDFAAGVPQSLRLPNLLVVGALDRSGQASFLTSYGSAVKVYAQGQDVEVLFPGGGRAVAMGTSLAAPKVVNLMGKLLAQRPALTAQQVIDLVMRGSVPAADTAFRAIDPQRTGQLLVSSRY